MGGPHTRVYEETQILDDVGSTILRGGPGPPFVLTYKCIDPLYAVGDNNDNCGSLACEGGT